MTRWIKFSLSAARFFIFLCIAEGEKTKELYVCPGKAANFSYNYNPEGYRRLQYIFTDNDGQILDMWKVKFDVQKPTFHDDYKERFSIISASEVGFTLQSVSSADIGKYICSVLYQNGTEIRLSWNLHLKDSTKLNKPEIFHKNEDQSGCVKYKCLHNETVEVDVYWKFDTGKRVNGSSLYICKNNRTTAIKCLIESVCNVTFEEKNITDCSSSRKKRSTPQDITDDCQDRDADVTEPCKSCTDGETVTDEDKQTLSFGEGTGIGIVIGSISSIACTIILICICKKRKNINIEEQKNDAPEAEAEMLWLKEVIHVV